MLLFCAADNLIVPDLLFGQILAILLTMLPYPHDHLGSQKKVEFIAQLGNKLTISIIDNLIDIKMKNMTIS